MRAGIHIIFFLFFHENLCCVLSSEVPHPGASVYPNMFSCRNEKNKSALFGRKQEVLYRTVIYFGCDHSKKYMLITVVICDILFIILNSSLLCKQRYICIYMRDLP